MSAKCIDCEGRGFYKGEYGMVAKCEHCFGTGRAIPEQKCENGGDDKCSDCLGSGLNVVAMVMPIIDELCNDLEGELNDRYPETTRDTFNVTLRKFDNDMEIVNKARFLMKRLNK